MTASSSNRSLPGTVVFAAAIAGAVTGALIGALSIAVDAGDPTYLDPDTRSAGLAAIAAMFGAGAGVVAGLIAGVAIWKLDGLLWRRLPFVWRSVVECILIAAFTVFCSRLAFTGLPTGSVSFVVLGGTLAASTLAVAYFVWRYRRDRKLAN